MRLFLVLPLVACVPFHHDNDQHIARMCVDRNYAYETGYNVGMNRGGLDTSWVGRCAPERQNGIRNGYRSGYEAGIANAPIVVNHTVNGKHDHRINGGGSFSSSYSSRECTFSSDCGDGRTCRSGVCYGDGWRGDACIFSSDCNSNDCNYASKTCR